MTSELKGGESILPGVLRGDLADAQVLSRYRWAGPVCKGRHVLEIGCRDGRGSALLLQHGARDVLGLDQAHAVIDAARPMSPQGLDLRYLAPEGLPVDSGSVQVVVWFDPLPYLRRLGGILDEVLRVLTPDGLLLAGWPNRDIVFRGNPQDRLVFQPGRFLSEIRERFADVRIYRQTDWTASAILDDGAFELGGGGALPEASLSKVAAARGGTEAYTLAIAGAAAPTGSELPPPAVMLAGVGDSAGWLELFEKQQAVIREHLLRIADLEQIRQERDEIRRGLRESEQATAESLRTVGQLQAVRDELEAAVRQLELELALVKGSHSWRLTEPLRGAGRAAKASARRALGRSAGKV